MQQVPIIFVPQLLFAGFFIKISQIPVFVRWAQYLCALKFALNLAVIIEFSECARAGVPGCIALFELNDVDPELQWAYAGVLIALFVGMQLLAMILLARRASANVY